VLDLDREFRSCARAESSWLVDPRTDHKNFTAASSRRSPIRSGPSNKPPTAPRASRTEWCTLPTAIEIEPQEAVAPPPIPIPFHKLLRSWRSSTATIARRASFLDQIAAEGFEIDVSDRLDRDVSDDAAVGAFIALVDGDRREHARRLVQTIRAIGFRMPLWALADSHRVADVAVLGLTGEVEGYIYLGQQSPAFYAKQVVASVDQVRHEPAAAVFRRADGVRRRRERRLRVPRPSRRTVLPEVAAGQLFFKHFGERSSATICATPTWISAIC